MTELAKTISKINRGSNNSLTVSDPIGDQVLWIVRRLDDQPLIQKQYQTELDPIVNRMLYLLDESEKVKDERKKWNLLL